MFVRLVVVGVVWLFAEGRAGNMKVGLRYLPPKSSFSEGGLAVASLQVVYVCSFGWRWCCLALRKYKLQI